MITFNDDLVTITEKDVWSSDMNRPTCMHSVTYRMKSAFIKSSLFVTISYIEDENGDKRPYELFINSKDLGKQAEFTVLTRLISAIFRKQRDWKFIVDELHGISAQEGGRFKNGTFMTSFYDELAYLLEEFFNSLEQQNDDDGEPPFKEEWLDPNIDEYGKKLAQAIADKADAEAEVKITHVVCDPDPDAEPFVWVDDLAVPDENTHKVCPECNKQALKVENGCDSCQECGYSKCDK
jgi:ribonucleoside-diphosphate reductase alpha chain